MLLHRTTGDLMTTKTAAALLSTLSLGLAFTLTGCDSDEKDTSSDTYDTATTTLPDDPVSQILALEGDALLGEAEYAARCSGCHGADGSGVEGNGPSLFDVVPTLSDDALVEAILYGTDYGMPAYEGQLTNQSMADLIAYLTGTYSR